VTIGYGPRPHPYLSAPYGFAFWMLPMPATYVLDQRGIIRRAWVGPASITGTMTEAVLAALSELDGREPRHQSVTGKEASQFKRLRVATATASWPGLSGLSRPSTTSRHFSNDGWTPATSSA
jgi:hypothetical protein